MNEFDICINLFLQSKAIVMKKLFILLSASFCFLNGKAQDFGQILAGSLADANKYATEYMRPFGEGEIYNLSRGWFSTARTHKLLGFDISVNGQFAVIPTEKQSFIFRNSDYKTFSLNGTATSANLPTFMGGTSDQVINVTNTVTVGGVPVTSTTNFTAPKGIGNDLKNNIGFLPISAPLPVAQVGIGLIKHTDLKVRYFPKTNFNDVSIGVFGVALQHEFSNYLPFIKKVPFLHLSALLGYSKIDADYKPKFDASSSVQSSDANAAFGINAFTIQGIVSAKFALLELYTSVGYSTGKSTFDMQGTYTVRYNNGLSTTVKDPLSIAYNAGGVSNTWGIRLNLSVLKIYADYTFAKYGGAGLGLALAFR
jgi:hypothetical protein